MLKEAANRGVPRNLDSQQKLLHVNGSVMTYKCMYKWTRDEKTHPPKYFKCLLTWNENEGKRGDSFGGVQSIKPV